VAIEATLADGEGRIDVEPARSWAVVRSLQRLPVASLDEPAPAVLACCEGETHTLALEALRALNDCDYGTLMLGRRRRVHRPYCRAGGPRPAGLPARRWQGQSSRRAQD
jgi:hypothetical protein